MTNTSEDWPSARFVTLYAPSATLNSLAGRSTLRTCVVPSVTMDSSSVVTTFDGSAKGAGLSSLGSRVELLTTASAVCRVPPKLGTRRHRQRLLCQRE